MADSVASRLDRVEQQIGAADERCPRCRKPISMAFQADSNAPLKCFCGEVLTNLPKRGIKIMQGVEGSDL